MTDQDGALLPDRVQSGGTVHPNPVDIAFVFVHGIGSQRPGHHLVSNTEPLFEWVQRWMRAGGGSALLRADTEASAPTRYEMELAFLGETAVRWELTEAHWADVFPAPPAGAMLRWAGRFSHRAARRVASQITRPGLAFIERLCNWSPSSRG